MYKEDIALDNLQWLICHKSQTNHDNFKCLYKKSIIIEGTS